MKSQILLLLVVCCLSTHQYSMHHMFWCTFSEPSNMSGSTKCIIDQHCRIKIQTISAPRFVHRIWTRILWLLSIIDDTFFFLVQMKTNWVTKKQKSSLSDFIINIIIIRIWLSDISLQKMLPKQPLECAFRVTANHSRPIKQLSQVMTALEHVPVKCAREPTVQAVTDSCIIQ